MPIEVGGTYRTRTVGDVLVTGVHVWPLRIANPPSLTLYEGMLLRDGRPARWDADGNFFGGLGNDPYDIILTNPSDAT